MIEHTYSKGLTVRELKKILETWSEKSEYYGEDCEVWITTGVMLSSPVTAITPLNFRTANGKDSADLLLESSVFE